MNNELPMQVAKWWNTLEGIYEAYIEYAEATGDQNAVERWLESDPGSTYARVMNDSWREDWEQSINEAFLEIKTRIDPRCYRDGKVVHSADASGTSGGA